MRLAGPLTALMCRCARGIIFATGPQNERPMPLHALLTRAVALTAVTIACGCHPDYAYGHQVEGQVVDPSGAPVANATVRRTTDDGQPFGLDSIYLRTTDSGGRFRFEYSGLGPKPVTAQSWRLVATHTSRGRGEARVSAVWRGAAYHSVPVTIVLR